MSLKLATLVWSYIIQCISFISCVCMYVLYHAFYTILSYVCIYIYYIYTCRIEYPLNSAKHIFCIIVYIFVYICIYVYICAYIIYIYIYMYVTSLTSVFLLLCVCYSDRMIPIYFLPVKFGAYYNTG